MGEKTTRVKRKVKKILHVLNPLAGKGVAAKIKENLDGSDYVYMSKSPDDTTDFIKKSCAECPDTCFTVYGGDGTVFKAVNAMMESGHAEEASLKIVPLGSGNDFVRSFEGMEDEFTSDVMSFNGRYAINVVNMGFDCAVVQRAASLKKKPLISGKMAYILGVVGEAFNKKPLRATLTLTYEDGTTETMANEDFLLIAVANGKWYGGGFKVAPGAELDDGLLDVTIVKNISMGTFVKLVGCFKSGSHVINPSKGIVKEGTEDFLFYRRCVGVKVEGCETVCADGEIFNESVVDIKVVPRAINIVKCKKDEIH